MRWRRSAAMRYGKILIRVKSGIFSGEALRSGHVSCFKSIMDRTYSKAMKLDLLRSPNPLPGCASAASPVSPKRGGYFRLLKSKGCSANLMTPRRNWQCGPRNRPNCGADLKLSCCSKYFLRLTVNPQVPGSSPGRGAKIYAARSDAPFLLAEQARRCCSKIQTPLTSIAHNSN